jgi:triosephosphate isomerase
LPPYRPLIAGNWKMNGLESALAEARLLAQAVEAMPPAARVAICPPATLISRLAALVGGAGIEVGAQDCHCEASGAFTGDVSAEMLADAGARLVILGHSERRANYREDDKLVGMKAAGALRAGLEPIVCVGETLDERASGAAVETVERQLRGSLPEALAGHAFAIAYEPVWAIGSGLTPSLEEIDQVHGVIRATLIDLFGEEEGRAPPILYGGSVKPLNAAGILRRPDVQGALVGGASLKAPDFLAIIQAA